MMTGSVPDTKELLEYLHLLMPQSDEKYRGQQDIDDFLKMLMKNSMLQLRSHYYVATPTMFCQGGCRTQRENMAIVDCSIIMEPCNSIHNGLKATFNDETLRNINCEKCSKRCDAKKKYMLEFSKTQLVTVFIKRTQRTGSIGSRSPRDVKNRTEMQINKHLHPYDKNGIQHKFELFAVINHSGDEVS